MKILLTGGTGFIGSHTAVELILENNEIVIVDNLSNSKRDILNKISEITGHKNIIFYQGDIYDKNLLNTIFTENRIDAVIHFAGHKAVGESVANPLKYYNNNIIGLLSLLEMMIKHEVKKLVFSSSATVYGDPKELPLTEQSPVKPINPYGRTKLMSEEIIKDITASDKSFRAISLRYFNPVGAHSSGLIGESPLGKPNNLFPYILSAIGKGHLNIYGDDYDTIDGTGVRDYIHIVDLAKAHLAALNYISKMDKNYELYNLGTGNGYSVLQIVEEFNKNLSEGQKVKYQITGRRKGDSAMVYADSSLAEKDFEWKCNKNLEDMVKDSINFYKKNS